MLGEDHPKEAIKFPGAAVIVVMRCSKRVLEVKLGSSGRTIKFS